MSKGERRKEKGERRKKKEEIRNICYYEESS